MAELAIVTLSRSPAYIERLSHALAERWRSPAAEFMLVDNSNTLAMRQTAQQAPVPWRGITPGYNTSFSRGCNLGVARTSAPWILLLNDDVIPSEGFLARLWAHRDRADIVGSLLLNANGTVNHAGTYVWASTCRTDHIGRRDSRERWEGEFAYTPSCTFAAAMVSRELWNDLGGLDEAYYYGWEDTDFCLRAIEKGARIGVARDAVAEHDECGTRPRGGAADVGNFQFFKQRWQGYLCALLESYVNRQQGVEGAFE